MQRMKIVQLAVSVMFILVVGMFAFVSFASAGELDNQLIQASKKGDVVQVKALLAKGANVNARGKNDETPLMVAAKAGNTETMQILIDKGADLNVKDTGCITALMWAAANGHADIVKLLIDNGADVNIKDCTGKTALGWAKLFQNYHPEIMPKIMQMLEKAMTKQ